MEICVIFNPAAARRRAGGRVEELRRRLGSRAEFRGTSAPGHAEELALEAARAGYPIVAAAGGDGTLHEVANGILRAERPGVRLGVVPLGSANDYAHSLGIGAEAGAAFLGECRQVDVGWARLGNGRERYFVNTLGLGFSGAVALRSRAIGRLRGLALYGLALVRALRWDFVTPTMIVRLDDQVRRGPTLSLTLAIGRREGNFVVAPAAEVDDGLLDYVYVGRLSRWRVMRLLPRVALGRPLPSDDPEIGLGRCREAHVEAETPITIHVDGELLAVPGDAVRSVEVRLLAGRLSVCCPGGG